MSPIQGQERPLVRAERKAGQDRSCARVADVLMQFSAPGPCFSICIHEPCPKTQ